MPDDERLVADARAGRAEAFRALYERHAPAVMRLAESFGGLDGDERADVVQESFVQAFQGLSQLQKPAHFSHWVLGIARHRCLNHRRGQKFGTRLRGFLTTEPREPVVPPLQALETAEAKHMVRELIDALPEGAEKQTAILFYVEGELSVREIAEKLGENKSTIAMRLERFRARFKLRLLARLKPENAVGGEE
jgi:RNA polymerase sigma-70 factor (ECF subfamily)